MPNGNHKNAYKSTAKNETPHKDSYRDITGLYKIWQTTTNNSKNGSIMLLTGLIGGVGQGGGASPIIWMTILMILMKAYKMNQEGATIWDCIQKKAIVVYIISYVDNNSIVRHFHQKATIEEIINEMKKNLQEWQKLLQITGGDLCLDKRKISIMKWQQKGEWGKMTRLKNK